METSEMPASTPRIRDFYKDKSVFITGASGFMGKVLLEKLLYSCPDVKRVYILLRPKNGKTPNKRLLEMFSLPMFQRLNNSPQLLKKVIVVEGDITREKLNMSSYNYEMVIKDVSVVFHCAATLKLESNLRDAVNFNIRGTYMVLNVATEMKNLTAFVHLSTAFCHVDKNVLHESVSRDFEHCPYFMMRLIEQLNDSLLDKITFDMIRPHPNTYTFTKRLAESLVSDFYKEIPVCIARPSIVCPAFREPLPGWVDSLNGPIGILVAAGKGVLRSMYCRREYNAEVIPVDFAINGLLAIGKKVAEEREKIEERSSTSCGIPVFNLTQSEEKTVSWGEILEMGKKFIFEVPFDVILWFPDGNIRSSLWAHKIYAFFLHWIPAYFIDFLLFIFHQKRFMIRVQKKIAVGLEVLQYFTTHKWTFRNVKFLEVRDEMCQEDKEEFPIDFKSVDDLPYLKQCILGAREYCLKEPKENLPRARKMIKVYYVLDRIVRFLLVLFTAHLIISWAGTANYVLDVIGENVQNAMGRFTSRNDVHIQRHG